MADRDGHSRGRIGRTRWLGAAERGRVLADGVDLGTGIALDELSLAQPGRTGDTGLGSDSCDP